MKTLQIVSAFCLGVALQVLPMSATAQDTNPAVVIEWNELALSTAPASAGPMVVRYYTIMHIAMFDAVNSIQRRYTPFLSEVPACVWRFVRGRRGTSRARRARGADSRRRPEGDFRCRAQRQAGDHPRRSGTQGVAIGKDAAARILAWRANDGIFITTTPPSYVLPLIPGLWQPAPTGPNFTHLPNATPFTTDSITQFAVPRHPELDSARYADDYEEVRLIGRVDSATRTPTQTETAKLWAALDITTTNLMRVWNNVVRDMTLSRNLSLLDSARLYAFVNATISDSLLNTFTGKFSYGLWRPRTAIRRGDEDFNVATVPDARLVAVAGDAAVSDLSGQHGRRRSLRGQCPRTRAWPGRHLVLGDVGSDPWQRALRPPVLKLLAAGPGGSGQPDLWRHSLPIRQRGELGRVRQARPARVFEVHGAAVESVPAIGYPGTTNSERPRFRGLSHQREAERTAP